MHYTFITDNEGLAAFCQSAMQAPAIALDTEFVRTRTLYPRLGLIQVFDGNQLVLIDPLSIDDFSPLNAVLASPDVVKVLHSCSEDLETFWHSLGVMPEPVFDTQFAACIVNMGATLGYANLVDIMLGVKLDKGESRTDWIARPLSEQQCQYAANDVLYLFELYPQLKDKVEQAGRLQWVYDEMKHLAHKKQKNLPPECAYLGIKNNWQLHGKSLYLLKQLAAWRLQMAREKDLAVNFVVKEQNLIEVARRKPQSKGDLFKINGMTPQEARINGPALIDMVASAKDVPPEMFPASIERLIEYPGFKKIAATIRQLCQEKADELSIPVEIMGSKKQIHQVLKWVWFELDETREMGLTPDLVSGWRQPILQPGIEEILGVKIKGQ